MCDLVKRWQPHSEYEPDEVWMEAQDDGDWVKYDDHCARIEALTAERDALAEKLARAVEALQRIVDDYPVSAGTSKSMDPELRQGYGSIRRAP